jgi:hypothetical protein
VEPGVLAHWTEAEQQLVPAQGTLQRYFSTHPVIGKINLVAAWFAGILGPMCWAALIILFVRAQWFAG